MNKIFLTLFCGLCCTGCAVKKTTTVKQDGPPKKTMDIRRIKNAIPKPLAPSVYGNLPVYTVDGITYHTLKTSKNFHACGIASWYGTKFNGHRTSSGEPYDLYAMTAANKTLPIPSYVKVTNQRNHKSIIVKVNDRGPFKKNRLIDLSYAAALKLDVVRHGTAPVCVDAIYFKRGATHEKTALFIQAGAFHSTENAALFSKKLKNTLKLPVKEIHSGLKKRALTRVLVGPMKTTQQTEKAMQMLARLGIQRPVPMTLER
jgi:rare lipoprotein A